MGEYTTIAWTDSSWNPWIGCTKVSLGCDHCYAEAQDHRWGHDSWGKDKPRRLTSEGNWRKPVQWNKEARIKGKRWKVFCGSLCDVMDDEAPSGARERLWELIDATPNLTWQLLTKRPHRYERYLPRHFKHRNVWLGFTAENQQFYDLRWSIVQPLVSMRGMISFVSYEPALGPLSIERWVDVNAGGWHWPQFFPTWVIAGGESGVGFRAMDPQWAVDLSRECAKHEVKFFMKQLSARTPKYGAELIPAELLIRQFPKE